VTDVFYLNLACLRYFISIIGAEKQNQMNVSSVTRHLNGENGVIIWQQ
jgi:hypothetical protein